MRHLSVAMIVMSVPAGTSIIAYWIGTGPSLADALSQFASSPFDTVIPVVLYGVPLLGMGLLGLHFTADREPTRRGVLPLVVAVVFLLALTDLAVRAARVWETQTTQSSLYKPDVARITADVVLLGPGPSSAAVAAVAVRR